MKPPGGYPFCSDEDKDRGTTIHRLCAASLSGTIDEEDEFDCWEYMDHLIAFKEAIGGLPAFDVGPEIETPLYSELYKYGGTADFIWPGKGILELKTGAKMAVHWLQVAAQEQLAVEAWGGRYTKWILYLHPEKPKGFTLLRKPAVKMAKEFSDFRTLLSAINVRKEYKITGVET